MTTKEALVRLNQPFNYPPDTDSWFDAKEVAMKSLEKDLSIIKELENIKAEIRQQQWYLGVDNVNQVIEIIDKHVFEIKGE